MDGERVPAQYKGTGARPCQGWASGAGAPPPPLLTRSGTNAPRPGRRRIGAGSTPGSDPYSASKTVAPRPGLRRIGRQGSQGGSCLPPFPPRRPRPAHPPRRAPGPYTSCVMFQLNSGRLLDFGRLLRLVDFGRLWYTWEDFGTPWEQSSSLEQSQHGIQRGLVSPTQSIRPRRAPEASP